MKNIKYLLFDLDGTLTDPMLGITNSVIYALKHFGIEVTDRTELYKFIGPPLIDSFMEFYGFSEAEANEALKIYREYFSVKGLYENQVYEGIPELLSSLNKAGIKIILATSKPEKFAIQILEHFDLYKYFYFCAGATMDESRNTKDAVIKYAIEKAKITDTTTALMIGDRKYDIEGARLNGLKSVGVLYGYGDRAEIEAANPSYIAETVSNLSRLILS